MASAPPLPLLKFLESGVQREPARTLTGSDLRQPDCPTPTPAIDAQARHVLSRAEVIAGLCLSRWFIQRCLQEKMFRNQDRRNSVRQRGESVLSAHMDGVIGEDGKGKSDSRADSCPQVVVDNTVYVCPPFEAPSADAPSDAAKHISQDRQLLEGSLAFDSFFESGNLQMARRVDGRAEVERAIHSSGVGAGPLPVDQEYDLTIRNDLFTCGNIQWYFFSAQAPDSKQGPRKAPLSFPLRVRFNLVNMQKSDSLYNYGLKPALCAVPALLVDATSRLEGSGWSHSGCYDVCYYCNERTYKTGKGAGSRSRKKFYTLSFSYDFQSPLDKAFFAHCFPYTYSDLQTYLERLDHDKFASELLHRKLLCTTLAGNRCDMLIISERSLDLADDIGKPAVVISARVHPGESNASHIMEGLIDYLLSPREEARLLRSKFVFKIVPMLNPDGVIHGNYRCSLLGTDLNRRYLSPDSGLLPTISAFKAMLESTVSSRGVFLFLDLHGHSKKKNSFLYGNDATQQTSKLAAQTRLSLNYNEQHIFNQRVHTRIFPHILSSVSSSGSSGYFSFEDCSFGVQRSKKGTGRVVCWRELGIEASYTVEASFCGNGSNVGMKHARRHFLHDGLKAQATSKESATVDETLYSVADFAAMGGHIVLAILHYANIDPACSPDAVIDSVLSKGSSSHIPQLGADSLLLPILFPAVFDPLLLRCEAASSSVRLASEDLIRRELLERAAADAAALQEGANAESDSDSEPSVNDGPAVKILLDSASIHNGRGSTKDLMKILRRHMAAQVREEEAASSTDCEDTDLLLADADRSDASSAVSEESYKPDAKAKLIYHSIRRKAPKPRPMRPTHQTTYKIDRRLMKSSSTPDYTAFGNTNNLSVKREQGSDSGDERLARLRKLSLQEDRTAGGSLDRDSELCNRYVRAPRAARRILQHPPPASTPEWLTDCTADILDDLTTQIRAFHPSVPMRVQLKRDQRSDSKRRIASDVNNEMKPFNESEPSSRVEQRPSDRYGITQSPTDLHGSQLRAIVFSGSGQGTHHSPSMERLQRHSPTNINSSTSNVNGHRAREASARASDAIFKDLLPEQVSRRVGQDVPVRVSNEQLVLHINRASAVASSTYLSASSGSGSQGALSSRKLLRQIATSSSRNTSTAAEDKSNPSSFSAEVEARRAQRGGIYCKEKI